MKIAPTFLFAVLLATPCFPQRYLTLPYYNVDSLRQMLPYQRGEEQVNTLNRLAVMLFYNDTAGSRAYEEEAIDLAQELDYERGIADAYRNRGYIYQHQGNFPKALDNFLESFSIYEMLDDKHTIGWIYYDLARAHYLAANCQKTIEYGYKALAVFRERIGGNLTVGNARDTIMTYCGLALAYRLTGNSGKAVSMFRMVLDLMRQNPFDHAVDAIITWSIGYDYWSIDEMDSARTYMYRTLAFPDENLNVQGIKARTELTLGQMYRYEGRWDSALFYYQKAFSWYKDHGMLYWACEMAMEIGWVHFKKNEIARSEIYLKQAEGFFNEIMLKNSSYAHDSVKHIVTFGLELFYPMSPSQWKMLIWGDGSTMYYMLYRLYEAKKRSDEALKYYIAHTDALDTLNRLEQSMAMIELQTRYETEQKEKQITSLERENEFKTYRLNQTRIMLFSLAGLVILTVGLAVVILYMFRLRERQNRLILQQKLLRSQMNPHFIFNSLVSIQNFIFNQKPAIAGKYLSRFSKLVRSILDSSFREFVPLEEEIDTVENYLELQKVRYGDLFDYTINIDPGIDTESMMIPPMLAQPMIENAIEHGIKHKEGKGRIDIRCRRCNDLAIFEVEDDGVGRKRAQEILMQQDKDHKSLATAITRERIAAMNRRAKQKITLEIVDLADDEGNARGTLVRFGIPV
ncbi:MAG TPA: tetratricopeptide repeat protein [Bacteroidales bacterium]|nr:tetratricopeptide repeat protein [Bacteroidales bacterium]HNS47571.1 tetratricopeptide repeat protein [Bacteroidales bacterium]